MKEIIYYTNNIKRKEFVFKILDIFKNFICDRVFIKPNQVSYEDYPTTTHPETIESVILYLKENGHKILCGDGQGVDVKDNAVENTKIRKICKKHGIEFINLYHYSMKTYKSIRGFKIKMSTIPFEVDTVISLPNLKSHPHWELHMTGALKMVVGYFSRWERIKLHMHAFLPIVRSRWKTIAEANWILFKSEGSPNHIIIMDAVKPLIHANELRHGGRPVELKPGYLLASSCPIVLDIFGFNLLKNIEPRYKNRDLNYVGYIKWAINYGVCGSEYELKVIKL